jgi:peptidyl-prolyl cis-trans isomerase C
VSFVTKNFSISPVLAGLFVFLTLSSCQQKYSKLVNKPVIQVNEHSMTTKEFANQLARRLKDLDGFTAKDPQIVKRAKDQILNDFITQSLIADWANTKNISISESAVDALVEKYRSNYPDDLSFRRLLAKEHLSFSEWREKLRHSLVEQAVFKKINEGVRPPTDAEIKKYYDDKKEHFKKKERVYIRQIVVDEMAKAEAIKSSLKGKDFAALAQKYSNAPEAKSGGIVGWVEKGSVDFFDSVFNSPVGSVSQIIQSPFGFHIIKVEKKLPASTSTLDEVRPQIIRDILASKEQAEFVSWLDKQIRSSKVLKDYDLINAINVDTRGTDD